MDSIRGKIRNDIISKATEDQKTILPAKHFGETWIIGEKHREAAEYYKEKIKTCDTMGKEIILNSETEEKFNVAVVNNQKRKR